MKITGKIEKALDKPDKGRNGMYSICIEGTWFNGWGSLPADLKEGLEVELEYTEKGEFKNIKSFASISQGNKPKQTELDNHAPQNRPKVKDREPAIIRQALLKASSTLVAPLLKKTEDLGEVEQATWEIAKNWYQRGQQEGLW